MGAMTASIAHEINQPLAAIMTNASAGSRWLTRAIRTLPKRKRLSIRSKKVATG